MKNGGFENGHTAVWTGNGLLAHKLGKGPQGIIVGMILTHWTYLARVVRAEVLQLKSSQYVITSKSLGKSNGYIVLHHILPHVYPQFLVGLILMFPHTILHEASLTFLGLAYHLINRELELSCRNRLII